MVSIGKNSGFTLIEVMVAAAILGVAISGVMSMLATGQSLESEDGIRRQARMYAAEALERPAYVVANYPLSVPSSHTENINLKTSNGNNIAATLKIEIQDSTAVWNDGEVLGTTLSLPCQTVKAEVEWTVAGRPPEKLSLHKTLADIQ